MKSNAQPPLYFSLYPLNSRQTEPSAKHSGQPSPYLKAVLSAKGGQGRSGAPARMVNSDRLAAIRYIRESRWRNNK